MLCEYSYNEYLKASLVMRLKTSRPWHLQAEIHQASTVPTWRTFSAYFRKQVTIKKYPFRLHCYSYLIMIF